MPILINSWTSTVTPYDDELGREPEIETYPFYEDEPFSFTELVDKLKEYNTLSSSHVDASTWAESEPNPNYRTGEYTHSSIHLSHNNSPRMTKYWIKALKAAGLRAA